METSASSRVLWRYSTEITGDVLNQEAVLLEWVGARDPEHSPNHVSITADEAVEVMREIMESAMKAEIAKHDERLSRFVKLAKELS